MRDFQMNWDTGANDIDFRFLNVNTNPARATTFFSIALELYISNQWGFHLNIALHHDMNKTCAVNITFLGERQIRYFFWKTYIIDNEFNPFPDRLSLLLFTEYFDNEIICIVYFNGAPAAAKPYRFISLFCINCLFIIYFATCFCNIYFKCNVRPRAHLINTVNALI